MPRRLATTAICLLVACGTRPPGPVAPAGIAELRLPLDAATLDRIGEADDARGDLGRRREVLLHVDRQLLMAPPDDAVVPELFDLVRVIAPRYASGELSPAWASYVYTTYRQDLVRDRPAGAPRRSRAEIAAELARAVEFFSIRARGEGRAAAGPAEGDFGAVQEWRNERRRAR